MGKWSNGQSSRAAPSAARTDFVYNKIYQWLPKPGNPIAAAILNNIKLLSVRSIDQHEAVRADLALHNLCSEVVAGNNLSANID